MRQEKWHLPSFYRVSMGMQMKKTNWHSEWTIFLTYFVGLHALYLGEFLIVDLY